MRTPLSFQVLLPLLFYPSKGLEREVCLALLETLVNIVRGNKHVLYAKILVKHEGVNIVRGDKYVLYAKNTPETLRCLV